MNKYEELKKKDFELEPKFINGSLMELLAENMMLSSVMQVEVKSENKHQWMYTGNIYIELYQLSQGKWHKSGLSSTTSTWWVHVLKDLDGNFEVPLVLPVKWLKERIRKLFDLGVCKIITKPKSIDGNSTKGILIPIKDLYLCEAEQTQHKKMMEEKQQKLINEVRASMRASNEV